MKEQFSNGTSIFSVGETTKYVTQQGSILVKGRKDLKLLLVEDEEEWLGFNRELE